MPDLIIIDQLQLSARIGVSDEERATPQRLSATICLEEKKGFSQLEDRLEATIDYGAVCAAVKNFTADSDCRLLETLGEMICAHLLEKFPARSIEIELRKFVLPETNFVAIKLRRPR
jgi:dihydroneopterin aldolase